MKKHNLTPKHHLMSASMAAALACLFLAPLTAGAATVTWNSSTPGAVWINAGNWSGGTPAGNDVLFTGTGLTASPTTVGNVVDEDISISSLAYQYNAANWTVTQINSDVTLTLTGGLSGSTILDVGIGTGANPVTQAALLGGGKLFVSQSDGNMKVSGRTNGNPNSTGLDLSGLASFEAVLDTISLGEGRGANSFHTGTLQLADENKITASSLFIGKLGAGQSVSSQSKGSVILGISNELLIDNITVGGNRGLGTLEFASGLEDATVMIRGKNSTAESPVRAVLDVGITMGGGTAAYGGTADFTGGNIDAYLSTLRIGILTDSSVVSSSSSFLMNSGAVDAEAVVIAQKTIGGANSTGTMSGLLDIGGGSLTTQTLSMAQQTGTAPGAAVAELKIHGTGEVEVTQGGIQMGNIGNTTATISLEDDGKLTVAGDIAKGAGTTHATLTVDGGTLELNGHDILVDALVAKSGTIRNIGEINAGSSWTKTGDETLRLEGGNAYSGRLLVSSGTLLLDGSVAQGNLTVENGAEFSMTENGLLQFNITSFASDQFILNGGGQASFQGAFIIDLGLALEVGSWNLFTGTTATDYFGLNGIDLNGTLAGELLNQGAGIWELQSGEWLVAFDANTGNFSLGVIPEPSSLALLALASLLLLRRKWHRHPADV